MLATGPVEGQGLHYNALGAAGAPNAHHAQRTYARKPPFHARVNYDKVSAELSTAGELGLEQKNQNDRQEVQRKAAELEKASAANHN